MAQRLGLGGHDSLHHFLNVAPWDDRPLEAELAVQADRLVGGPQAWLVVDDTALPKKGRHSVGVAPQYASVLGKTANCQTLVSLTLEVPVPVPVPVGLRLFLPESWTGDLARLARAEVPEAWRAPRTKPEIALAEIDRVVAAGVRFGGVLADAGYGASAAFRHGLEVAEQRRDSLSSVGRRASPGPARRPAPIGYAGNGSFGYCHRTVMPPCRALSSRNFVWL